MKQHRPTLRELELDELENYDQETDSETEALQEAFARGDIKPGLNIAVEDKSKTNNVPLLKERLEDIKVDLPWVERLDVSNKLAPLAPELSLQLQETAKGPNPLVFDELKRESVFYRQAQAAVLSVLPKLKKLGLLTERPEDYFAEMAKTDSHMQKVKAEAIKKKLLMERVEKLREIRAQKKVQKQLNAQAKVAKVQSKKEMLDQVKKYRKGEVKSLDFLESGHKQRSQPSNKVIQKKNRKDAKFGFGGKKRGWKKNTRDSTSGVEKSNLRRVQPKKGGKINKTTAKRPGKSVRQKMKSKKA